MQLWLKRSGYSVQLINILPTFIDIIRALSSWLGTTLAGCLSLRGIWSFQFVSLFLFCLTCYERLTEADFHVLRLYRPRCMERPRRAQVRRLL